MVVKGAVWGGLMATRAATIGVRGVVTDGRCRDRGELREKSFPVFAANISCHGSGGFAVPSTIGEPVVLNGVTVQSGSIVIADMNGVVVIPLDRLADVMAECERAKPIEEACMRDLEAGKPLAETFKLHRGK